jgi:hypothetical protein
MFKKYRSFTLDQGVKTPSLAVVCHAGYIMVLLHDTLVFSAKEGKNRKWIATLNNGGYDTVSTRLVINQALKCLWNLDCYDLRRIKGNTYVVYTNAVTGDTSKELFTNESKWS